jgi:hypothetical protein
LVRELQTLTWVVRRTRKKKRRKQTRKKMILLSRSLRRRTNVRIRMIQMIRPSTKMNRRRMNVKIHCTIRHRSSPRRHRCGCDSAMMLRHHHWGYRRLRSPATFWQRGGRRL